MNPALASWMALRYNSTALVATKQAGILGISATSASRRVAVRTARALGATRVVGSA